MAGMEQSAGQTISQTHGTEAHRCGVLIMYEDLLTGLHANSMLERLSSQLDGGSGLNKTYWMINLLNTPGLQDQAVSEAASADVILLSTGPKRELPRALWEWLVGWRMRKENRPYAFGILLNADPGEAEENDRWIADVRKLTSLAGVDFFYSVNRKHRRCAQTV